MERLSTGNLKDILFRIDHSVIPSQGLPPAIMNMVLDEEVPELWADYFLQPKLFQILNRMALFQRQPSMTRSSSLVTDSQGEESEEDQEVKEIMRSDSGCSSGYPSLRSSVVSSGDSDTDGGEVTIAWTKFVGMDKLPQPGTKEYLKFMPFRQTILGERERIAREDKNSLYSKLFIECNGFKNPPPSL